MHFGVMEPSRRRLTLRIRFLCFVALGTILTPALSFGQSVPSDSPSSASSDAQPLPMPSMSGPLQTAVPHEVEGGTLAVTGILSGIVLTEGNHIAGDQATHYDVSNAQLFVQKTNGWWQFYLQGGAYNLHAIG